MNAVDTRVLHLSTLAWLTDPDSTAPAMFKEWIKYEHILGNRRLMPPGASGAGLAARMASTMQNATLWYVTDELASIVEEAAKTMPLTALRRSDFPSETGWLVFEKPRDFKATDGVDVSTDAILWSVEDIATNDWHDNVYSGAVMFEWALTHRLPETDLSDKYATGTAIFPATVGTMTYGRIPWVPYEMPSPFRKGSDKPGWSLIDPDVKAVMEKFYTAQIDPEAPPIPEDAEIIEGDSETLRYIYRTKHGTTVRLQPDPAWRFIAALFWLLQDEYPWLGREDFPVRKSDRRALRFHRLPMHPVSMIYWRRRAKSKETGTGTPLSYRYLRRGHWRNQWYPSEGRHRPKLILPTIVGDPSLPFVERAHVNVVNR